MIQNHSKYTPQDFKVWKTLFDRQIQNLEMSASEVYLRAINDVGFSAAAIPDFTKVNERLIQATGFQLQAVPHIVPNEIFFPLLNKRIFTATTWLRNMEQLDYLEEPDMFHDVFGHVPLLSNATFCNFFHGLAKIAVKHIHNPAIIEMLGRVYWFTIEFGLINENNQLKIYGAGIASSYGETNYALSNAPMHLPFDVRSIMNTEYDNMRIQEKYFVIDSFEQLFQSLSSIENEIQCTPANS